MNIISICVAAIVTSVLAVLLKKHNAEYSLILTVCCVTLILMYLISSVVFAVSGIEDIFANSSIDITYMETLLKCVGICFVTEFTCDCCKDASQNALSSVVLMSGRICVLITAFPLFKEFLSLSLDLTGGGG
ncbi:MAG: hypothetical protein IJ298_05555 [Ruminococcus sp.]|nr:hypothetical protein [Ruminococcus sp.]